MQHEGVETRRCAKTKQLDTISHRTSLQNENNEQRDAHRTGGIAFQSTGAVQRALRMLLTPLLIETVPSTVTISLASLVA